MLKKLFNKSKPEEANPAPGTPPPTESRLDTTHAHVDMVGNVLLAKIKPETVSDRESRVLIDELAAALDGTPHRLVVDLSAVEILTSSGIGMLVQLHKATTGAGGKFAVCGLSDDLLDLLKLTRMDRLFTISTDEAAALAAAGK